jgi:hypothetical protein
MIIREKAAGFMENKRILVVLLTLLFSCQAAEKEEEVASTQNFIEQQQKLFVQKKAEETGIYFINELPEDRYRNILMYQYYYNGGGVAIGDINNDNLPDIFFSGNLSSSKLYLNRGNWQFEDITFTAGISPNDGKSWHTGVSMIDINNDGWLDIYVCRSGNFEPQNRKNLLYINNRNGTFTENAGFYGLDDPGYSVQAVFFDYDRDDDLDMFLLNHGMEYYGRTSTQDAQQRDPYVGDKLYRREKDKSYTDVSAKAGILGFSRGYGLGVGVADLNQDGWDDIYVANDFYEHDYLYLNRKDGSFEESIKKSTGHISFFGMGVDLADFNNDALTDIVVLDMAAEDHVRQKSNLAGVSRDKFQDLVDKGYHYQYMFNSLQLNRGIKPDGGLVFSNIAQMAGVDKTDWSWSPLLADFDNDGWKDLFVTNGLRKDVLNHDFIQNMNTSLEKAGSNFIELPEVEVEQILKSIPSEPVHNYIYQNNGGLTFQDKSQSWGLETPSFSNGAAYADLDRDGDLDLVVNNLDQVAMLYENKSRQQYQQHYLRLKLKGSAQNPMALGTKVWLYHAGKLQYQQFQTVRGYQSSVEPVMHFGLGDNPSVDSLKIRWPDGKERVYPDIKGDKIVTASIQDSKEVVQTTPAAKPWLEEVSEELGLNIRHEENSFDDFDYQFLLPHQLSRHGPALAVGDVDGDGLDDVYLGGAKGFAGQLMMQQKDGTFRKVEGPWLQDKGSEDADALFLDMDHDGDMDLYVLSGGMEFEADDPLLQDRLYINDGQANFSKSDILPAVLTNSQCIAAADMDNDGDIDIFVGGGSQPGNYPLADRSYLLENRNGTLVDVTSAKAPQLQQTAIIRDACWTDADQDGKPELLVVGEWSKPMFYEWNDGKLAGTDFILKNEHNSSADLAGLWFSISPMDVDGDGDEDFLLGNRGLNYRFSASTKEPLELFVHDMDKNGTLELFLAHHQDGKLLPVQERDDIFQQWRGIRKLFPNYTTYANADLQEIMGDAMKEAYHLKVDTLAHLILYNEGNGNFRVEALPLLGQLSVVVDALFTDISGDGKEELIIAGNFYPTSIQIPRLDASYGQVFTTRENHFSPVSIQQSGFYASGDVRRMALLNTINGKAILVATNDQTLKMYKTANVLVKRLVQAE